MSKKNKTKTRDTQMFTVTCHVTGEQKRVRKPVFMKRVNRVQSLVRSITGDRISTAEAQNVLDTSYVGTAGRRQAGCDYLGQPNDFALAFKASRKPKTTSRKKSNTPAKAKLSNRDGSRENAMTKVVRKVVEAVTPVTPATV